MTLAIVEFPRQSFLFQRLIDLFGFDRQFEQPHADRIGHGVGDGRRRPVVGEFAIGLESSGPTRRWILPEQFSAPGCP